MQQWKTALAAGAMTIGGILVGATFFGAEPANAQRPTGYSQCFFGRQETVDIDSNGVVAMPQRDRTIAVPRGYDVVSGGGYVGYGVILFCRR